MQTASGIKTAIRPKGYMSNSSTTASTVVATISRRQKLLICGFNRTRVK